ncbi:UMP-CMP kinase [Diplonema papillatum]|nr:UMP-CMP kinase [Diplonema papillatum]
MSTWRNASEKYLRLHQINEVWAKISHELVVAKPSDVHESMLTQLKYMRSERGFPGKRLVFLVGGPGSGLLEAAEKLEADLGCSLIDGKELVESAGGPHATGESVALALRSTLVQRPLSSVFVLHGFPTSISHALLTEIQVTPASICVFLSVPEVEQAAALGIHEAELKEQMKASVTPVLEYYKAKGTLVDVEKSDGNWYETLKTVVETEKNKSANPS